MNRPPYVIEEAADVIESRSKGQAIAIIGMACLFPKARDLEAFWSNILGKVNAVTAPPSESWDPNIYYDPSSSETDRVYCKQGGFLGDLAYFDPLEHGVPPLAVGGEPDQWLALNIARKALEDAGYPELSEAVRHRTAVVLGRGATFNAGTAISVQHSLAITQTISILKKLHPEYSDAELEELRQGLKSSLPSMAPEIVPGLVPNVIVGRIANRLDLMGPSYTVDAACASSLVAVQIAVRDLVNGDCDLALAGGAHIWTPMPMLSVFSQLNALSHKEQIRPFDKDADGTILGEGLGMLVLKRLDEAERDGDRIYAVIRGVGLASDGRAVGVMAPRVEGEELSMRRAYEAAGVSPDSVELIEAHGTGTLVGDFTEIQALTRVFGRRDGRLPRVALGTVKSMISHTVAAAGVAGMIKTALALHNKMLPPTLNCTEPNPRFELERTPFYISTEGRPWIHAGDEPRRAGVSAFGFGGINAHVVLEEHRIGTSPALSGRLSDHRPAWDSEVFILRAASQADLLKKALDLKRVTEAALAETPGPLESSTRLQDIAYTSVLEAVQPDAVNVYALSVVATSLADLDAKLAKAAGRLADPGTRHFQERSGVFYNAEPLAPDGKLAFLFPGEGSQYVNMLADLCLHFPDVRAHFDAMDCVYRDCGRDYVLSDFVFPRPTFDAKEKAWTDSQLWDMDIAPGAVLTADGALLSILEGLGVRPDVLVGHSSGEWAALQAAGVFGSSPEERREWIARDLLDLFRVTVEQDNVPPAALLAIGADRATVESVIAGVGGGVSIAMDNCPHQVVVATPLAAVEAVTEACRALGLVAERLAFDRPYHTPQFAAYSKRLLSTLEGLPLQSPRIPVYSAATAAPFPGEAAGIRELTSGQWVREVQFARTIEKLYEAGTRLFVEVGPRGSLTAFVEDILRKRPFCAVSANEQRRSGITQINHLVGMLAVQGVAMDLTYLYRWRSPRRLDVTAAGTEGFQGKQSTSTVLLKTQFPALQIPDELVDRLRAKSLGVAASAQANGQAPAPVISQNDGKTDLSLISQPTIAPPALPPVAPAAHAFFETMERFLALEERVVTEYLRIPGALESSSGSGGRATEASQEGPHQPSSPVPVIEPPPSGKDVQSR